MFPKMIPYLLGFRFQHTDIGQGLDIDIDIPIDPDKEKLIPMTMTYLLGFWFQVSVAQT